MVYDFLQFYLIARLLIIGGFAPQRDPATRSISLTWKLIMALEWWIPYQTCQRVNLKQMFWWWFIAELLHWVIWLCMKIMYIRVRVGHSMKIKDQSGGLGAKGGSKIWSASLSEKCWRITISKNVQVWETLSCSVVFKIGYLLIYLFILFKPVFPLN